MKLLFRFPELETRHLWDLSDFLHNGVLSSGCMQRVSCYVFLPSKHLLSAALGAPPPPKNPMSLPKQLQGARTLLRLGTEGGQKRYHKDFAELSGEFSVAICLKTLVFTG